MTDWCVYTIAHGEGLAKAQRQGAQQVSFQERKRWTGAENRLAVARRQGQRVPVLLADSRRTSRLRWWGFLEDVALSERGTIFRVDRIRQLPGMHRPQDLTLLTGARIAPGFIRPYALCRTPTFLADRFGVDSAVSLQTWPGTPALTLLADSVDHAHEAGPAAWVVTTNRGTIRLDVGQVAMLTIAHDGVDLYARKPVSLGRFTEGSSTGRSSVYSRLALPASVQRIRIPLPDVERIPRRMLTAHYAAIGAAARAKTRSPWRAKLATGLVDDMERLLGRSLPRPEYLNTAANEAGQQYWVVKGRRDQNDFESMLQPGRRDSWRTSRPPRAWAAGDRLFFWESSPARHVVGLGTLLSVPVGNHARRREIRFGVRYLTRVLDHPVSQEALRAVPAVQGASFLESGPSGTLFPLTKAQAEALLALVRRQNPALRVDWPELPSNPADVLTINDVDNSATEGGQKLVEHYRRERSRRLIEWKKAEYQRKHGHLSCEICGFNFKGAYGALGDGYCEVHHTKPLSARVRAGRTKLSELAVVCSNCHRIIHRTVVPVSIRAMRRSVDSLRGRGVDG
jgi:hypothetical protein